MRGLMKKISSIIPVLIVLSFAFIPLAFAQTVTYTISVTIPEIPGVNVPPFTEDQQQQREILLAKANLESYTDEVTRDNRRVTRKTIVPK